MTSHEQFETSSKKVRGMAQASLKLIEAMHEAAETQRVYRLLKDSE
jgi:hypothetical protein